MTDVGKYRLPPHTGEVMYLFGFPDGADASSDLRFWWRTDGDPMTLFALCSDVFHWATADLERIEEADMPLLRTCFADLTPLDDLLWLGELFASRKRGMRPMRAFLKIINNASTLALFEAAGPERDPRSEG